MEGEEVVSELGRGSEVGSMGSGVKLPALAPCCVIPGNLLCFSEPPLTSGEQEWESLMGDCECHVKKAYEVLSVRLGTEARGYSHTLPRGQVGGKWSGQRKQLTYRSVLGNLSCWEELGLSACGKRTERGG